GGAISELVPKPEKKSAQSFYKFVIERGNSRRLVIYGFSNGFLSLNPLVGVLTIPRFWDKFLKEFSESLANFITETLS
ncbi:hypothetical protein QQ983_16985, partial [Leptospira borgpetersenii]|uniref:hypothetical protein n=2 Tax=Leptospira borgpetersenii TaxID=174 RepID=UPI0027E95F42